MNRFKLFALLIAWQVFAQVVSSSHAAVISLQPKIAAFFTTDFMPTPGPRTRPTAGTDESPFPLIVQVDVFMEVLSLEPGEDSFGSAVFDFSLESEFGPLSTIAPATGAGWAANNFPIDTNGAAPGGVLQIFSTNEDVGADDLKDIFVVLNSNTSLASDPRRDLGEAGSTLGVPFLFGSAFVEWNGLGRVAISLNSIDVSAKSLNGTFVPGTSEPADILILGIYMPEPSSFVLLTICLAGLSFRRRVG